MPMQSLKVVYLGNIISVAKELRSMHGVELLGCIYEDKDDVNDYVALYRRHAIRSTRLIDKSCLPDALESYGSFDLGLIANFGIILSNDLIKRAKYGFVNAHPGLLPHNKGRNPIEYTLNNKESQTGITLHQVTTQVDEGPILATAKIDVHPESNVSTLGQLLYNQAPSLFQGYVQRLLN
ncbi:MAG: methionyl-tRNA formyltransferase [Candidatus Omnitrophota bacterium]|jgi:methionyl-tRNA formyltransferase